jgi:very-short-patch-repair endonuclease
MTRPTKPAQRLRRTATDAERKLWYALGNCRSVWKFRRQHPIGKYITDFACPARKLAIEIDGSQHQTQRAADAARSEELGKRGYRVIRFWNTEVLQNTDGVVERILSELASLPTSPRPSPP